MVDAPIVSGYERRDARLPRPARRLTVGGVLQQLASPQSNRPHVDDAVLAHRERVTMLSWGYRTALLVAAAIIAACQTAPPAGGPIRPDTEPEAWNMRLLGHEALQARSAYQPVIIQQNGRWLAYIGHHGGRRPNALTGQTENNGTSIVDVTNPRQPRYLVHIAGDIGEGESGGAQMVRVCPGRMLPKRDPAKFYMLRVFGDTAQEIWDVTSPERPQLITTIVKGL